MVGPATTIEAGLSIAGSESFDAAVLDINVRGERINSVADLLVSRGIPMLFATGYGVAGERRNASVIDKPYTQERLASALAHALAMQRPSTRPCEGGDRMRGRRRKPAAARILVRLR